MTGFQRAAITGLVCLLGLAGGVAPSSAADYPNRPVRWLIGFTAGGPVDTVARIMSQWLSERFGQQFVVENRAGSGGNIAAAAAINSPPDGYTLLFVGAQQCHQHLALQEAALRFHPRHRAGRQHHATDQHDGGAECMPVKTVQEFIDYCKANPGKVSVCLLGQRHIGAHVGGAVQGADQGRNDACALSRLVGRDAGPDFQQGAGDLRQSAQRAGAGARRHAAGARVTSPQRWPGVPDIPAIAETVAGIRVRRVLRHLRAQGTPPEIIDILNKAVGEALKDPKTGGGGSPMPAASRSR